MYFFWSQECIVGVSDMCLKPLAGQVKSTGSALHGHLEPILPRMPFPGSYAGKDTNPINPPLALNHFARPSTRRPRLFYLSGSSSLAGKSPADPASADGENSTHDRPEMEAAQQIERQAYEG